MEREIMEPTSHSDFVDHQVNTPPTHQPPGAKKARDELVIGITRKNAARAQVQNLLEMA